MVKLAIFAAIASLAVAKDNSTCSSDVDINSQADLDKITRCQVFDGSINIRTDAGILVLNGVKEITGGLSITNSTELSSFNAPVLERIQGTFRLERLTILRTLAMPKVTELNSIKFITLPALEQLQFNSGVEKAKDILISDTSLKSLQGLNLSHVEHFEVNNNRNIKEISVTASQISQVLDVSYNAAKVNVSFPNLKWVKNATFRFCSSISMPKLTKVNNSLGFVNNTVRTLDFKNLEEVGSLTVASNSELRNVSFPKLKTINGGFVIANNSHFQNVYGFPKLETIRGAIVFQGNLSKASLPRLSEVDGGVKIDSSADFDCSTFDKAHENGDFHGDEYVCKGSSNTVSTKLSSSATGSGSRSGKGPSATKSGSKSNSNKKKNAAASLNPVGNGIMGAVMAFFLQIV